MSAYLEISQTKENGQADSLMVAKEMVAEPGAKYREDGVDPRNVARGKRIRDLREANDMSQHELAIKLGITAGAVGQWEIGISRPGPKNADQLARLFGVTRDWLEEGDKSARGQIASSAHEEKMLRLYRRLSSSEQKVVIRQLEGMVAKT